MSEKLDNLVTRLRQSVGKHDRYLNVIAITSPCNDETRCQIAEQVLLEPPLQNAQAQYERIVRMRREADQPAPPDVNIPYTPTDRIPNGTRVLTVEPEEISDDWTSEALVMRRFGVTGEVVGHHDSHGLCYDVRHDDDGTIGCYDPWELQLENE